MRGAPNPGLLGQVLPLALLAGAAWFLMRRPAGGGPSFLDSLLSSGSVPAPLPGVQSSLFAFAPSAPAPAPSYTAPAPVGAMPAYAPTMLTAPYVGAEEPPMYTMEAPAAPPASADYVAAAQWGGIPSASSGAWCPPGNPNKANPGSVPPPGGWGPMDALMLGSGYYGCQ